MSYLSLQNNFDNITEKQKTSIFVVIDDCNILHETFFFKMSNADEAWGIFIWL